MAGHSEFSNREGKVKDFFIKVIWLDFLLHFSPNSFKNKCRRVPTPAGGPHPEPSSPVGAHRGPARFLPAPHCAEAGEDAAEPTAHLPVRNCSKPRLLIK